MKNLRAALLCVFLGGCASVPSPVFYSLNQLEHLTSKTLDRMVWENELSQEEPLSSTVILKSDEASYHLIQVRGAEKKHMHEYHDLAVFVQSGTGTMFLGKEKFNVRGGAVIFVPHGIPHYFVNTGPQPAVAVSVFSPPFDGKDIVYP